MGKRSQTNGNVWSAMKEKGYIFKKQENHLLKIQCLYGMGMTCKGLLPDTQVRLFKGKALACTVSRTINPIHEALA